MLTTRGTQRSVATATLLLACLLLAQLAAAAPARAATGSEHRVTYLINQDRAAHGLRALRLSDGLSDYARKHSRRMADANRIFHNARLPYDLRHWSWTYLGENVGRGATVTRVHTGFMQSPIHRPLILDRDFRRVGVGVVYSGPYAYVTVIFYG